MTIKRDSSLLLLRKTATGHLCTTCCAAGVPVYDCGDPDYVTVVFDGVVASSDPAYCYDYGVTPPLLKLQYHIGTLVDGAYVLPRVEAGLYKLSIATDGQTWYYASEYGWLKGDFTTTEIQVSYSYSPYTGKGFFSITVTKIIDAVPPGEPLRLLQYFYVWNDSSCCYVSDDMPMTLNLMRNPNSIPTTCRSGPSPGTPSCEFSGSVQVIIERFYLWDAEQHYSTGVVVAWKGRFYISIADSLNKEPTLNIGTYWELFVCED